MNILVLNGSPCPHGNTAALVNTFADEAQKAGHHVSVFQIGIFAAVKIVMPAVPH
jgi:multimeric flavodoxin WrbA